MKWRRVIIGIAALAGVVVAIAGISLVWLLSSQSGARFVFDRAASVLGDSFRFGVLSGDLLGGVILDDVDYYSERLDVSAENLRLRVVPGMLLRGTLEIDELSATAVEVSINESPNSPVGAGAAGFALPIPVVIRRASIGSLAILRVDENVSLERLILAASLEGQRAEILRFETRWQDLFVSIQGRAGWESSLALEGIVSWSGQIRDVALTGSTNVTGIWPRVDIDLELLDPVTAYASGSLLVAQEPAFDLEVLSPEYGELTLTGSFDAGDDIWRLESVSAAIDEGVFAPAWNEPLQVGGGLAARIGDAWRFETSGLTLESSLAQSAISVSMAGAVDSVSGISIDRLDAVRGENAIRISGRIDESFDADILLELDSLATLGEAGTALLPAGPMAELMPLLAGSANGAVAITGSRDAPSIEGEINVTEAGLGELPLAADLEFATTGNVAGIAIRRFEASLGTSTISGEGQLFVDAGLSPELLNSAAALRSANHQLLVQAMIADLTEVAGLASSLDNGALAGFDAWLADIGGAASVRAVFGGSLDRPGLDINVSLDQARIRDVLLARASADIEAELYAGGNLSLSLDAETDELSLGLSGRGELTGQSWIGELTAVEILEPVFGVWGLRSPVATAIGPGEFQLKDACLANGTSSLCLDWHYGSDADRFELSASDIELATLNPLLPPEITLAGRIDLDASLDDLTGTPFGSLSAAAPEIAISVAMSETDRVTTLLHDVSVAAMLEEFGAVLEAGFDSPTGGSAQIAMGVADIRSETTDISGRLEIYWTDLAAVSLLSADFGNVGGVLEVSVDVAGNMRAPELSGRAMLGDGYIELPGVGLVVERLEAEALSFDGGTLDFSGSGFIRDSELTLSGTTLLDPQAGWPTEVRIAGDNVPVSQRADAVIFASPDLTINVLLPDIDVAGTIGIPEASISVDQLPAQAVSVSPDSVVHGLNAEESGRPLTVAADINIVLGDRVRYTGSGLDAALSGGLLLGYESGTAPVASGSLSLAGSYDAFGQRLDLQRGELLFAGPLENPAIDVLAVREIGTTTVGVRLSGTLQAPVPSIYSDPTMSEINALSYLRFGRPQSSTDDTETATLESAALALGLQQALPAIQRVGETLGLDELSIEPNEVDAGALMAGKYLSPRVYMSYSYGLFNRLGGFLLRYDINERLSLETRSGSEKSMDLLYSIEKD